MSASLPDIFRLAHNETAASDRTADAVSTRCFCCTLSSSTLPQSNARTIRVDGGRLHDSCRMAGYAPAAIVRCTSRSR